MTLLLRNSTLSLLIGLVSGTLCWFGVRMLPDGSLVLDLFPGLVFGISLYLLCAHVLKLPARGRLAAPLILAGAGVIGWRMAIDVGHIGPWPFMASGLVGGAVVALALCLAWHLHRSLWLLLILVTAAGGLGGGIFEAVNAIVHESNPIWPLLLFVEWQVVIMVATTLAAHRQAALS